MSKKIKDEQKKFLGETLNQYDKALDEAINQLDKKNREQNHKISSLVNSFDNEYLEKDVEGNMTALENSKDGMVIINEIQGSTEVNYCKDGEKELILNGDIDTQGKSFVTITESVDGGLVDVSLEGNTEINLSKTKDPVLVTREFDDINYNVGKLQYTIDDVTTINDEPGKVDIDRIVGDTMVNHAVNGSEELILNAHINESGDNSITLNGVTSDGGKVDVALEGNTLVNVSKTKDSTAITKAYTVENSGNHIALQGDVDGSCRPVITGNTLVNLISDNYTMKGCTYSNNNFTLDLSNSGYVECKFELVYDVKPSTDYTCIFNIIQNDSKITVGGTNTNELGVFGSNIKSTGLKVLKITTSDSITNGNKLAFWSYAGDIESGSIIFSKPILLEGDYTNKPIPDYFDGLQSSFEDNLVTQEMVDSGEEVADNLGKYRVDYKVTGKNKFKLSSLVHQKTLLTSIKKGEIYTLSYDYSEGNTGDDRVQLITSPIGNQSTGGEVNGQVDYAFNRSQIGRNSITITSTIDGYLYLRIVTPNTTNKYVSNIQLEEGDTATTYEPYKEYKKTLYLNSPLLEGDTIEEKDGGIYHVHRYKSRVLNGSDDEGWVYWSDNTANAGLSSNLITFYSSNIDNFIEYTEYRDNMRCDKFICRPTTWVTQTECIALNGDSTIRLQLAISRSKLSTLDSDGFKQWLQQNPVTIVYELASPTYELIEQSNLAIPSYANGHLDFNTAVLVEKVQFKAFSEKMTYLYANTQYTVQFVSDKAITADITLGGTKLLAQSIVAGLNRISITTPSELVNNKLVISGVGANISDVVVTDTNREFKYFEGMKSVGECEDNKIEILSQNKNLYVNCFEIGDINQNTGLNRDDTSIYRTRDYIKVEPNTTYSFSRGFTSTWQVVFFYDANKNFINYNNGFKTRFITPNNAHYVRYKFLFDDSSGDYTMQIEKGQNVTDYIEGKANTQTLTHEPLRAVGDVKDKYVLLDGKWYIERNIRQKLLTGTDNEAWLIHNDSNEKVIEFKCNVGSPAVISNSNSTIADKLIGKSIGNIDRIAWSNRNVYITISRNKLATVDVAGLRQWLSNNNVLVQNQLATPQYEPIDYNPLEVYSDVTHITTNSTIPCNVIVKNHGYNMVALKENTQYTLYVNKDTTNTLTYRLGDYIEINSPSKFTFTTPSTLTDKTLRIDGKGTKVNDLMLIEGTLTNDSVGYFDGLKNSYECEQVTDENDENYGKYKVDIKVVGKNLWQDNIKSTQYDWSELIKLDKNKTYTASYSTSTKTPYIKQYDENKKIIPMDETFTTKGKRITGASYIRIQNFKYLTNLQLEEGNTATDYEPYFESKQTIYLNSPLLKDDEIVWKDNKIQHYHKMNTVVLDGSDDEDWGSVESKGNNIKFGKAFSSAKYFSLHKCPLKCDNFITQSAIFDESLYEMATIYCHSEISKELRLSICKSKLQTQDLQGFKQWLQQNPTTVVYPLETPYYEEISGYPLKLNVIANSSLSTESTIQVTNISFNIYEETLPYLYPNTKYYITFNADVDRNNIIINLGGSHTVLDCKVGFNKVEITTPSDTTNLLTFSGTGVNIDHVKVTQQDIDEYFEGMKSVGECEGNVIEILSNNKNLIDPSRVVKDKDIDSKTGEVVDNSSYYALVDYVPIKPNMPLKYSATKVGTEHNPINGTMFHFYDINKKHIYSCYLLSTGLLPSSVINGKTPSNAHYLRISYGINDGWGTSYETLLTGQLEYGTTKTDYILHQSNIQQLTHEPLRAVGDVKDRYVLIDGKWYIERKYGEAVLDGSVVSGNVSSYFPSDNSSIFFIKKEDAKSYDNWLACDKFMPNINVSNSENRNVEGIFTSVNGSITAFYFRIFNNKLSTQDINGCKQYLQQNPVTVVYQLATPIYEPIDYNPFETYADVTHITTNSLIPTNVVVKNHGYNCILKPSTKYTVALNKPNGTISAKLGGSTKVDSTNNVFTITTPSTLNDNILRLSGSGKVKDIIILEGDKTVNTPSYFEGIESAFEQEYDTEKGKYRVTAKVVGYGKESNITFYINEPLRGVENNKDKVFIQDNKVVVQRNCASLVLDGDTNIDKWSGAVIREGLYWYDFPIDNLFALNNKSKVMCNTLICDLQNSHERTYTGTIGGVGGVIRIVSQYDTQDFKQWLQDNPTTVVYQLAEPVYEEADCDLSKLVLENYENSSLIFESNIPVSANIKYSGEVPVVTQAKSLSSQVDNTTLDINENIIPYMCDIDYRIVELQLMNGDTQGEGIELLGIGDIEILGNENVLFNNREDKKYNYSYDMLKRDILSQRYSKEEYQYRLDRYLLANKISDEEYKELEGLLNNGE